MKKTIIVLGIITLVAAAILIFFSLRSQNALVIHPKGMIAQKELKLIITNVSLMLIIIVPTTIVLLITAWKYRSSNRKAKYEPNKIAGKRGELILWFIPAIIVCVMAFVTWYATHELDPYKPIDGEKRLKIQVVALDWKWLFIYPEQKIASVNFVHFPEKTPIHFELAADGSPMNSFWIPELSGQIYAMTGMITPLHIIADGIGEYRGRAAEINGAGFADMTFIAKSSPEEDFNTWVANAKLANQGLTSQTYEKLLERSINVPITIYSDVDGNLFDEIVMKYMHPMHTQ